MSRSADSQLGRDLAAARRWLDQIATDDPATRHLADVISLTRHTLDCVWRPIIDELAGAPWPSPEDLCRRESVEVDAADQPSESLRR